MARDARPSRAEKRIARATAALGLVPFGTPASPSERGLDECPCTKECSLHGSCHLCVAYHATKRSLPRCER